MSTASSTFERKHTIRITVQDNKQRYKLYFYTLRQAHHYMRDNVHLGIKSVVDLKTGRRVEFSR